MKRALGIAIMFALTAGLASPGLAQDKKQKDPNEKKKSDELKSVYKKWLDEDVSIIITDDERKAFRSLKTDEERDSFIDHFWHLRDQDPDTPENEYKEQYYERVQYANEKYASGIPGWKTDRGRIYIRFGKPDEIESHPSGGSYDRPSYEGGGTTSTYPFETWWYRHIEGIGSDIEIEFVDPSGSGEYRIARSPDEKDALKYVPNAGLTLAETLGLSTKAERIGGAYGNEGRAKDQRFEKLALQTDLERPPAIKFPDLRIKVGLPEIASDILPYSVRTDFMRLSGESVVTSFTVQFDHQDLAFKNVGGIYGSTVNIYAQVNSLSDRRTAQFEDILQTGRYTEDQLVVGQTQRSIYEKNVVLAAGRYKIDVVARDVVSGKTGIVHHSFEVPRYQEKQLATSTLMLASSIEKISGRSLLGDDHFIRGQYKVMPFVSGVYKPGQNLALYLQVYDAAMDQATLQPALKVEYIVSKGGREILHILEDGKGKMGFIDLRGQQLTVVRAIPLQGVLAEPGAYVVTAKITDLVSQQVVTPVSHYSVVGK